MLNCLRLVMGAKIVDGRRISLAVQEEVSLGVSKLVERGLEPHLAVSRLLWSNGP